MRLWYVDRSSFSVALFAVVLLAMLLLAVAAPVNELEAGAFS
jgi:hypothetical protein